MNWPLAVLALAGLLALTIVADRFERRAERRAERSDRAAARRRLLDEIRRHK